MKSKVKIVCGFWVVLTAFVTVGAGALTSQVTDKLGPILSLFNSSQVGVAVINQSTLPDGRTLIHGVEKNSEIFGRPITGTFNLAPRGAAQPPLTVASQFVNYYFPYYVMSPDGIYGYDADMCGLELLDQDGRPKMWGGSRFLVNATLTTFRVVGLPYSTQYNSSTNNWTRTAEFGGMGEINNTKYPVSGRERWYPTPIRLSGTTNRVLVIGGATELDLSGGQARYFPNLSIELWENGNFVKVISTKEQTPPQIFHEDYTFAWEQPDGRILIMGQSGEPVILDLPASLATNQPVWIQGLAPRPGTQSGEIPNYGATAVMLPLKLIDGGQDNGTVAVVGGQLATSHEMALDLYKPATNQWTRYLLPRGAHYSNVALLPDGRLIIMGGVNTGNIDAGRAIYFNPGTSMMSLGSSVMPELRGYHVNFTRVRDGRFIISGGKAGTRTTSLGGELATLRVYEPDYLQKVQVLAGVQIPAEAHLGLTFWTRSLGAPISDAVLMALSANTHGTDPSQRQIQLRTVQTVELNPADRYIQYEVPVDTRLLPPGEYDLYLRDQSGVPSNGMRFKVLP
jgi:hypothetical protein